jgi:hypothetical protein
MTHCSPATLSNVDASGAAGDVAMLLTAGTGLGPYEVLAPLGAAEWIRTHCRHSPG